MAKEFKSARIEKVENGYQVSVTIKMDKPSRKDIADMNSPQEALVDGDYVTDYIEYNADTLDEAIELIKESEDKDGE